MMPYLYFNPVGMGFILIAAILSLVAQMFVKSNYSKYSKVKTMGSMTGADVARRILELNNITDVEVVQSKGGVLSDHYDPTKKIVALSPDVYKNNSIASVSVAAHEVGHAIQHAEAYAFIGIRNKLLPLAITGNSISMIAIMIGIFAQDTTIFYVGIGALLLMAAFQLVTLPVEFNASARALKILDQQAILTQNELPGARKMLSAAALTYVAALVATLMSVLRYIAVFNSRKD
ncbi:zinc metallopeptidase [Erysipelothrix aquatica]|uniref:zinc metallopeptidase n=1 Tax=Erysipelothrix aquatica TaxID=2683714 RepID=UPI001F17DFEA|nr:zinc metallopeptidase [Erysipelothrix aquatica]